MIIKQKGLHHSVFVHLLAYLSDDEAQDVNTFTLEDIDPGEIEELFSFGEGEEPSLIGEGGVPRVILRAFARIMSANVEYSDGDMYWSVVLEIPDEVKIGKLGKGGCLKKDYDQDISVTSSRILLEIHKILKGID